MMRRGACKLGNVSRKLQEDTALVKRYKSDIDLPQRTLGEIMLQAVLHGPLLNLTEHANPCHFGCWLLWNQLP